MAVMTSTLVETVSINCEDFSESFLTCSTCLCTYDGGEHIPKQLACSHTVCLHCLIRIVQAAQTRNESRLPRESPNSFRCPICREEIQVPRGGVGALPPSFLVNQLLDLMSRQRREVIPKCGIHPSQELLFCETCDSVFCSFCTSVSHGTPSSNNSNSNNNCGSNSNDHTVVPFSIAIKRMSEILLYKANEVATKLIQAEESVSVELGRLEENRNAALKSVEETFVNLETCLMKAKEGTLKSVNQLAARKRQLLTEQLDLIKKERSLVDKDVNGLQYQVEVRSLSDRIADFQKKLEVVSALAEPRENSYLIYEIQVKRAELEQQLDDLVCALGRPRSSTALPSLCNLRLSRNQGRSHSHSSSHSSSILSTHHGVCGVVDTVDYHGSPRKEGGDPVQVTVLELKNRSPLACWVMDVGNGSYRFWFRPPKAQTYVVQASIFGRPVKNSPLNVQVVDQQKPHNVAGSKGHKDHQFFQPSGIVLACSGCRETDDCTVYVLDSGNQRIAKYSRHLQLIGYLSSAAVEGQSATGMCLNNSNCALWIANWKLKSVIEISTESGQVLRTVALPFLQEPVDVAINSQGQLLIADAEQATVYVVEFTSSGTECRLVYECGSRGSGPGQFQQNTLRTVARGANDDVVAADSTRIQIFSSQGKFIRTLPTTIVKGLFGGLSYDGRGYLLATYNEASKKKPSRCGVWVIHYSTGDVLFNFDSSAANLRRPGRICCTTVNQELLTSTNNMNNNTKEEDDDDDELHPYQASYIYVTDLGDDSVKQYRYL